MHAKAGTRLVRRVAVPAAATVLALTAAACTGGSSSGGAIGSGTAASGHARHGGTVTIGWENATPNFIFPYAPATNSDGYNVNLTEQMWPYVVYSSDGAKSVVNTRDSLHSSITYSDGDRTVTIDLKHWNWSDGVPITSRDFTFV
jgi:peptide/nickel transport system substrate-binding protein